MSRPVISAAELMEAVEAIEAAEFGRLARPLDTHEGAAQAFYDAEQRHYDLFGPSTEERFNMGYGYHEARYGEKL